MQARLCQPLSLDQSEKKIVFPSPQIPYHSAPWLPRTFLRALWSLLWWCSLPRPWSMNYLMGSCVINLIIPRTETFAWHSSSLFKDINQKVMTKETIRYLVMWSCGRNQVKVIELNPVLRSKEVACSRHQMKAIMIWSLALLILDISFLSRTILYVCMTSR